ncbi:glycosyltransferase involved in cell wall biosynthesis [Acinetobacter calcoaceticus]|uniref:Glycosyltransferase involved in cell wall biosynthesis n=1 Tax=Acinetobacter calcoaceticus TaxID=471 RepID=A0A4R1XLU5_ACICA|nr:glycosyltransferase involved in cell wall biosynthesis [Acinetobacter calcoaceticus]
MKNVCFLIGDINLSGGTERVTTLIANALATESNCKVNILSLSHGKQPFFEVDKRIQFHSLYKEQVSMKKNYISALWKIRKYILQHEVDTLIVVDSILCMFTVPALMGLKTKHICWEHFNFNVDLGVSFRRIGRKWAAKYCDYVVTLTKRDKELWEQGLKNIKAKIIPIANPTPYENIENTPKLDYKIVLAMGRLTYQKGFDLLLEAWSEVCKKNNDWTLRIIGGGEDEGRLKEQAKFLGLVERIDFIPASKHVEQYYRSSSFYCMSSRFEGLPMVLLEAQAFGLPIVSFDCDTGPSELIQNNINGFLVENKNTQSFAENILKLINLNSKEYDGFVQSSRDISKKYGSERVVNCWQELILK